MGWTSWKGFNFRDSAAYVTDGTDEQFTDSTTQAVIRAYTDVKDVGSPGDQVYTTIGGDNIQWGRTTALVDMSRDRSNSIDVRLAGGAFCGNTVTPRHAFKIALPSAGAYEIRLALGDASFATRNYFRILDDASELWAVDNTASETAAGSFVDANGTTHTAANWPANNTTKILTFSSSVFVLEWGGNNTSANTANSSMLSHLAIRAVGVAPVISRITAALGGIA